MVNKFKVFNNDFVYLKRITPLNNLRYIET